MTEKVTHIRLNWAGGEHCFKLDFDPPAEPRGTEAFSPYYGLGLHDRERTVLQRLVSADWGVDDVKVPIRLGLIGGGDFAPDRSLTAPPWAEVDALIAEHVLRRPLADSVPLAQTILLAAIVGVDPALAERGLEPVQMTAEDMAAGLVSALVEAD